ncbi:chromosomal replication initiator protein DnaA [Firmicutes bacterium CAG:884]|nr:chromosomal replication initiator protein DnaA [Firmicutes bacterium CAG:884]
MNLNIEQLWISVLDKIKLIVDPVAYTTWFENTKIYAIDDDTINLIVPYEAAKTILKQRYQENMEEIVFDLTGTNYNFKYFLDSEIKKEEEICEIKEVEEEKLISNLNPNYTFDNFIVGTSNKFAYVSALAIAESPGMMYNPLFVYGRSGVGKTHLMHAIGNYISKKHHKNVLYVTCEQFINDFVEIYAGKNGYNYDRVAEFKKKYRKIDTLLIDDIQFLETALKSQQEFFNIFNELTTNNKQIVLCSDRSPDDLRKLEDRLRTRFTSGLPVDIQPPDFELRLNIIKNKIVEKGVVVNIPDEVIEYIASNCTTDIRKLECSLNRVLMYSSMMGGAEITYDFAIEALKNFFVVTVTDKNKIEQVQQIVANQYNVNVEDLKSKRRNNTLVIPRQVAMYICRIMLDENLEKIGMAFGGKNHATVCHAVDKIKKEIETNEQLKIAINKIYSQLGNVNNSNY